MTTTTSGVTKKEKFSYGLYFMGQNIFYVLIGYMTTFFTDIGITAAMVALVVLITKVWDAVNDPIFGAIMDKVQFKKGKFVPWLRISLVAIPLATVLLFAIPSGIPMWGKILWATLAYMMWDTAYTISDIPIFGLVTTITADQKERISLNSTGRIFAMIAAIVIAVIVPAFRQSLGGWTQTVVVLSLVAVVTMIPICLSAKERVVELAEKEKEQSYTLREMMRCVAQNKYLLIFFLSITVNNMLNVGSSWGMYIARYCLGGEEAASLVTLVSIVPTLLGAFITPALCKKHDKFKVYYTFVAASVVLGVVKFFAGYENFVVYLVLSAVSSVPGGIAFMLLYQFTPDCYEYAQYKTGMKLRGVTFAAQTFFIKLGSALTTAVSTFALTFIGFVEGENAIQTAGFDNKLWLFSCLGGVIGGIATLVILHFYKLNDHDVQLMAKANLGQISREEAEAQMKNQY